MPRQQRFIRPKRGSRTDGPTLRIRRTKSGALVTYAVFNGKFFSFGPADDPQSRVSFAQAKAAWERNQRKLRRPAAESPVLTIDQLADRYLDHEARRLQLPDGTVRRQWQNIKLAVAGLRTEFGTWHARAFEPQHLVDLQGKLARNGMVRSLVNYRVSIVKRLFRWAVVQGLVPADCWHRLQAVQNVQRGEFSAREGKKRLPVSEAHMRAVLPFLSRQLATVVELQGLTAARPSEILGARPCDIDRSSDPWLLRPAQHKTQLLGKEREIPLGKEAQALLRPWLDRVPAPNADLPIFRPDEAERERHAMQRAERRTPLQPSQRARRRKHSPTVAPGTAFDAWSYRKAVARAIEAANRALGKRLLDGALGPLLPEDLRAFAIDLVARMPQRFRARHVVRLLARIDRQARKRRMAIDRFALRVAARAALRKAKASPELIPDWTPYQLRHSALTRIRAQLGVEAAIAVAGHSAARVIETYSAEAKKALARDVARRLG